MEPKRTLEVLKTSRDELERRFGVRRLALFGRSCGRTSNATRSRSDAWSVGLQNRLIHGHPGIDDGVVWSVIQNDTPELIEALESLVAAP